MTKNDVTYQVYENLFLNDPTFQQLSNDDKKETLTKLKQFIITGDASLKTETYRSVENKKMDKLLKTDKATIQKEMKRIMSELNDITGEFNSPKKGFETEYQNLIKRWKELNNTLKSL
jgi:membrane-associated HD superfamily phosphohydrolase